MSTPLPWGDTQPPWAIGQVKHLGSVTLGKMLQTKDNGEDVFALYMRAANVQPDGVLALDDVKEMWFSRSELDDLTLRQGDVVVVEGGQGGFGRAAYVGEDLDGWGFQNSINRIRSNAGSDGRFLAYYLIALRATGFIRRYCNVVSMPHLTAEKLAAIPLPLPSGPEQRAIADYLDRETTEIDGLITAQERFIGLLQERRQAVVEHELAGVVPAAPGTRLKHLVRSVRQGWSPQCLPWPGDGVQTWAVLKAGAANRGIFRPEESKVLPEDLEPRPSTVVRCGDLVVSRANTRELVGSAAVVSGDYPRLMLSDKLYALALDESKALPRYVAHLMASHRIRDLIEMAASGASSSMLNISRDQIMNLPMNVPELGEQRRILNHLDDETAKIDVLIAKTQRHVELARERRSALITAAVTGQMNIPVEV
ncbi:type I restriction enzyme, S subunit [Streptomyces sp. ScaeMP-e48]|uniref:restriction endonuclease subunit S n=1 Tax=Streptomyces sp. ScaeMP-e48 TaxID=1100823 RepID=UPI000823EB8D|nr:restriction endonuclease subunit S [Streptomyces sp. ScaeMP-e48]SCK52214.1 type I restriction enzyme, S subunit [Streptomyces sp. ScaeMP-e48]